MAYFEALQKALKLEKEEDRKQFARLAQTLSTAERREAGSTWFPIAIRDTEIGRGDYLTIEIERTTHHDLLHQFRFGMSAALFSQHNSKEWRTEGIITRISGNRLKLSLRIDELPDWTRNGKLGLDAVFDENSYEEMEKALQQAAKLQESKEEGSLVRLLTGKGKPFFGEPTPTPQSLNQLQQQAAALITKAKQLAIVHGPPGTGKTTTLVAAIKALWQQQGQQLLVVAPSNAAVDLLTERLADEGLQVVRVGNPARVNEKQLALTLDQQIAAHAGNKEIRRLRKQAAEYRGLAQKYKRSFGPEERAQRNALFTEARNLMKEVEKLEQYIADDLLNRAEVVTATLVGANHYTVRNRRYETVVIDEAGQALEPATWIPVLKGKKLVMAGDHRQLPPTVKSTQAADTLGKTLMEKLTEFYPEAVVMLEEQYRMHPAIMQFPSQELYEGRLKAHPSIANRVLFDGDLPLEFIDTAGCGFEELKEGNGISNPEEGRLLQQHLQSLLLQLEGQAISASVALISPYRHQVEWLKEMVTGNEMLRNLPALSVNTIDAFQGQERDVVYISLTRSNTDSSIGFLSDIRRMNVAMTRARKKLVMIGDSATLAQNAFYGDLIDYAQQTGGYRSAWELMG